MPGTPDSAQPIDRKSAALTAGFALLLLAIFLPVITKLFAQFLDDENYRHGMLVPVISAIVLYQRRDALRAARSNDGAVIGWLVCLAAGALLIAGTAAGELMSSRLALPTMIIGLAFIFGGRSFVRAAAFPLFFLYMMVPLPYIIYYKIAFPLQLAAAKISAGFMDAIGVSLIRHGNVILLPGYALEVVAACSGLRALLTMVTLALVIGAFAELPMNRRVALVALAAPIAVVANVVRLVVTGMGAYLITPAFADGFLHTISGLVVFLTGFALLMLSFLILRRGT